MWLILTALVKQGNKILESELIYLDEQTDFAWDVLFW